MWIKSVLTLWLGLSCANAQILPLILPALQSSSFTSVVQGSGLQLASPVMDIVFPVKTAGQCLGIDSLLKVINVDNATLAAANTTAEALYNSYVIIIQYLDSRNITLGGTVGEFLSVDAPAKDFAQDSIKSEIIDFLVDVLKEEKGNPGDDTSNAVFDTPPIFTMDIQDRIQKDSATDNCKSPDAYKYYQFGGACASKTRSGAGLANREMPLVGPLHCAADFKCKLPSARVLSNLLWKILSLFPPLHLLFPIPNNWVLYWGQANVHDIAQGAPTGPIKGGRAPAVCSRNDRSLSKKLQSPFGHPIDVACDDDFYKPFNVTCLHYSHNRINNEDGKARKAGFNNNVSPLFDLGALYEYTDPATGEVKSTQGLNGSLLKDDDGNYIIFYGNNRQHTQLSVVHLSYGVFHDVIRVELIRLDPTYLDDFDRLFRDCKKINIVIYQYLTYEHYLEVFLGTDAPVVQNKTLNTYQPNSDPRVTQLFDIVARITHILVTETARLADKLFTALKDVLLRDTYGRVDLAYKYFIQFMCGMVQKQWQVNSISDGIRGNLFFDKLRKYGHDLFAIDIERARSGCTMTYAQYLRKTKNVCITTWTDLLKFLPVYAVALLKQVYCDPQDVELYVAALSELPNGLGKFGPTAVEIMSDGFARIKAGDPRMYTNIYDDATLAKLRVMTSNDYICIVGQLTKCLSDSRFGQMGLLINGAVDCKHKTISELFPDIRIFL